ncbi:MAG TPA: hypothetical protein VGK63_10600 [Candidatus Limnocylindrales bacterium]
MVVGHRFDRHEITRVEQRLVTLPPNGSPQRDRKRAGGCSVALGPGVLLGAKGPLEDHGASPSVLDRSTRTVQTGHLEAVARQRPGLVRDDEVDGAEDLLCVESADENAAAKEPIRPKPEDHGQQDRRLLRDRRDRGRYAGEQVRRSRIPPGEPESGRDDDQRDSDDEQDSNEAVELVFERCSSATTAAEAAGNAADLSGAAGRDHEALASAADDARSRVGDRVPLDQGGGGRIGLDPAGLGDRFAREDASIYQQAVGA